MWGFFVCSNPKTADDDQDDRTTVEGGWILQVKIYVNSICIFVTKRTSVLTKFDLK
jgi:hypothetical protein